MTYIKTKPVLVETDTTSFFIQNTIDEHLYQNQDFFDIKHPKYVDLFLTYLNQDFERGEELTHRITGEKHTFVRWEGSMLVTHYETEIGSGEDWTGKNLLQFNEQIIATSNKKFGFPIIPNNFIKKFMCHNNNEEDNSIEMVEVLVGDIELYEDGMEYFCTYCHKSENECECKDEYYIKTKYPNNEILLKQK